MTCHSKKSNNKINNGPVQYQEPETAAAKWNSATNFTVYTCDFLTVTCQNVLKKAFCAYISKNSTLIIPTVFLLSDASLIRCTCSLIPEEEKSGPAAGITTQLTDSWLCHTSNTTLGPNQLLNRSERRLPELLTSYHSSLNLLVAHKHHNVPGTQTKKRGDKSFIERCGPLFNQHG